MIHSNGPLLRIYYLININSKFWENQLIKKLVIECYWLICRWERRTEIGDARTLSVDLVGDAENGSDGGEGGWDDFIVEDLRREGGGGGAPWRPSRQPLRAWRIQVGHESINLFRLCFSSDLLSVLVLFVFWKTTTTYSALHSAIALASHVATSLHQTNAFQEGNN